MLSLDSRYMATPSCLHCIYHKQKALPWQSSFLIQREYNCSIHPSSLVADEIAKRRTSKVLVCKSSLRSQEFPYSLYKQMPELERKKTQIHQVIYLFLKDMMHTKETARWIRIIQYFLLFGTNIKVFYENTALVKALINYNPYCKTK